MTGGPVGLVLASEIPPEQLAPMTAEAERAGFAEVWLAEDCFFNGGIAGAAIALGATRSIPVGLGVVSAVTRHPAVLAMEVATLSRAFPGRVLPAVGLGVPAWLQQMGVHPPSPLRAIRECMAMVRDLLDGKQSDASGGMFHADAIKLAYPSQHRIPLQMGVAGPKMLQLSGEVADGTLLSVLAGVDYVRWAREQIEVGRQRGDRLALPHRVTTFALCSVGTEGERARAEARRAVAFYLSAGGPNALTEAYGISEDLRLLLAHGGPDVVEREMPDRWVEDLAVAGTADQCAAAIRRLIEAGSDRVALFPVPAHSARSTVGVLARDVLPQLTDVPSGPRR